MDTPVNPYIARIRATWERLGILNLSTATETDLTSFEYRYSVKVAPILRDYFRELNGTTRGKLGMDDANLIGFWHLNQVRPMSEECPEYATTREPNLFVFADYSIWAHAYAMRLTSGLNGETAVFLIGGRLPLQIAPTFEQFLTNYSAGDQKMLFG